MAAEGPMVERGPLYEYVRNLLIGFEAVDKWLHSDQQENGCNLKQDIAEAFKEPWHGAPTHRDILQSVPTPQRNLTLIRQQRNFGEQIKKLDRELKVRPEARRPVPTAPGPVSNPLPGATARGGEIASTAVSEEAPPPNSGKLSRGSAEPVEQKKEDPPKAVPPPTVLASPPPAAAAAVAAPPARAPSPRAGASAAATPASTANARAPPAGSRVQEMKKMFEASRQPTPPVGRPAWAPLRSATGSAAGSVAGSVAGSAAASDGPAPSEEEGEAAAGGAVVVGNQASVSALLSEGRRREDVPVPKSIRAAEQSKLQEERRQREREQREREQRDLQKASIVAVARQAMTGTAVSAVGASTSSAAPKVGAKAKAAAAAPVRKVQRRSAVLCTDAEAASAQEAAPAEVAPAQQQPSSQPQAPSAEAEGRQPQPLQSAWSTVEEPAPEPAEATVPGALRERPLNVNSSAHGEGSGESPRAKPSRSATSPQESWGLLRKVKLAPPRPEDNYELSEPEEGGEDSEGDDAKAAQRRAKKFVPRWCENYMVSLSQQADVDPDTILGSRVPQCDLASIFSDRLYAQVGKSRPKRANGSSQDWRRDRLTKHEIHKYKEKMGQTKGWTFDVEGAANVAPAPYKSPRPRAGADAGGA